MIRSGDVNIEGILLKSLKNMEVNDDFIYDVMPGLLYSCSRKVYDFLFSLIFENRSLCSNGNPDSDKPVSCSVEILKQMSDRIENLPVKIDAAGDFTGKLSNLKEWYSANKNTYVIIKNSQ